MGFIGSYIYIYIYSCIICTNCSFNYRTLQLRSKRGRGGGGKPKQKKREAWGEGEKISVHRRFAAKNSISPYNLQRISTTIALSRVEFMLAKKNFCGRNSEITLLKQQLLFHCFHNSFIIILRIMRMRKGHHH